MYDPRCIRCVQARRGGYDGCTLHNRARMRYVAPTTTVVVTDTHRHDYYDSAPAVGVDISTGDPVLNIGGGLGVDMRTGDVEMNIGGVGYVDVDPSPSSWDSGCSDW